MFDILLIIIVGILFIWGIAIILHMLLNKPKGNKLNQQLQNFNNYLESITKKPIRLLTINEEKLLQLFIKFNERGKI